MATVSPPRTPPPPPGPTAGSAPPAPTVFPRSAATGAAVDDLATLCLFGVTLAAAFGFFRLFAGTSFLLYALCAATIGHVVPWALRRAGVGLTGASIAAVVGSALTAIWLVAPNHTSYGFITPTTLERVGADVSAAREVFQDAVAPVAPLPGFLLAVTFGLTLVAFLADWAAFRMRASFEAVVPAFALFVITAIFGTSRYRTAAVVLLAVTSLLFLVVQRAALDAERGTWFANRSAGALRSLLVTGAALGAASLLIGVVVGPRLPGATAKALIDWRPDNGGGEGGSRSTISPLVDIRGRLVDPTDAEVFRVQAERPSYWRLTSLDAFDGNIWSSNEKYRQTKGQLAPDTDLIGRSLRQSFTISALSSIWLPAAYRPQSVTGAKGISYSERSASLISREATTDGIAYEITSVVPDVSPQLLRAAPPSVAGTSGLGPELAVLSVKPRVQPRVQALLNRLTAGQRTGYDKAKAIQDHLRTFTYDLSVGPGHSSDALSTFLLTTRRGYCEQFAGAFAVLARLAGLPSRVAVGFQPGVGADGSFQVRDKDAHAWPEVWFEGVGWVAFEPTPPDGVGGDGNPDAASYTGVPYVPQQAGDPTAQQEPSGQDPSAAGAPTTTTPATQPDDPAQAESQTDSQAEAPWFRRPLGRFAIGLALFLVLGAAALLTAWAVAERRRRRIRAAATTPAQRVAHAWERTEEALALARVTRRSTMTVDEWLLRLHRPSSGAAAAGIERGGAADQALDRLARSVVDTAYGGASVPEAVAAQAEADAGIVTSAAHEAAGLWRVLDWRIDPHPAIDDWRRARRDRREPPRAPSTA